MASHQPRSTHQHNDREAGLDEEVEPNENHGGEHDEARRLLRRDVDWSHLRWGRACCGSRPEQRACVAATDGLALPRGPMDGRCDNGRHSQGPDDRGGCVERGAAQRVAQRGRPRSRCRERCLQAAAVLLVDEEGGKWMVPDAAHGQIAVQEAAGLEARRAAGGRLREQARLARA